MGAVEDASLSGDSLLLKFGENFGKNIAESLVLAGAITALGYALPKDVIGEHSLELSMEFVSAMSIASPIGFVTAPIIPMIQIFNEVSNQQNRMGYNSGDRAHGRLGYVRDGDTWYPAFIKLREKWAGGYAETGNDLDLVYGDKLSYRILDNGMPAPYFAGWHKEMHTSTKNDEEINTHPSGADKLGTNMINPLRNWYLLPGDQMQVVNIHGAEMIVPKSGKLDAYHDSWDLVRGGGGKLGTSPWAMANLDLTRGLDYMQDWSEAYLGKGSDQYGTGIRWSDGFNKVFIEFWF